MPRLHEQVRSVIRLEPDSIKPEEASVRWMKEYILHPRKRQPLELSAADICQFLSHLTEKLQTRFESPGERLQKPLR
jgi:hypothetical protein